MDYLALFFVITIVTLFVTALKSTANSQPTTICKRHTWVRVDLTEEQSYLKCAVCKLVAGNEPSFEEREPQ